MYTLQLYRVYDRPRGTPWLCSSSVHSCTTTILRHPALAVLRADPHKRSMLLSPPADYSLHREVRVQCLQHTEHSYHVSRHRHSCITAHRSHWALAEKNSVWSQHSMDMDRYMEHGAWGMGHGAWGMGHSASAHQRIAHGAWNTRLERDSVRDPSQSFLGSTVDRESP